jgi:putative transposase
MTKRSPFRYFKTSSEIIRLAGMMYLRFPLSLRNVENLLNEGGIEISYEMFGFGGTDLARCLPLRFAR